MFTLTMTTDGAAFEDPAEEIARILRTTANQFGGHGPSDGVLYDSNGNRVGTWTYEPAGR